MADLFDYAFLARQRTAYPHLDVDAHAASVRELHGRKPVLNPNGLLIHRLTEAEKARRAAWGARDAAAAAELDQYAEFWVELLKLASARQLAPHQVLRCIRAARAAGYTKLNVRIEAQLERLGDRWPTAPAHTPDIGASGSTHDRRSNAVGLQAKAG